MLVISFFLTNVDLKQFGVAMLFMSFKEILLHSVHLFAGPIIPPLSVSNCSAYAQCNTCELDKNSFGFAWSSDGGRSFNINV
jgi:hypothetical protein